MHEERTLYGQSSRCNAYMDGSKFVSNLPKLWNQINSTKLRNKLCLLSLAYGVALAVHTED